MAALFASYRLKVQRALEQADQLDSALGWWLRSEPYRVEAQVNANTGYQEIVVVAKQPPPERFSLMLGDAIQNFRSALDYIVGDLVRINSGGVVPDSIEKRLQFPITTCRKNLKTAIRSQGRLGSGRHRVPVYAGAFIQWMQPYRHGQDISRSALYALHQLSNIDKHRRIPLLMSVVREFQIDSAYKGEDVEDFQILGCGPFEDKAVLVRWFPADAKDVEVDMDPKRVRIGVALGEGLPGAGSDPRKVFREISDWIARNILVPLEEKFL